MGRWDVGVYDSDSALDFFAFEVANRIEREMAYYMSPMRYIRLEEWLGQVLSIIEVILLFDQNNIGSAVFLWEHDYLVHQWKQTIFPIWDAAWDNDESRFPYGRYSYRVENRPVLETLFKRLDELVEGYGEGEPSTLDELTADHQLPYFSIYEYKDKKGRISLYPTGYCPGTLCKEMTKNIIYTLAEENTYNAVGIFEIEKVWVCVDIIGFLCETFQLSPGMTVRTIDRWEKRMYDIWTMRNRETPEDGWVMTEFDEMIDRIFNRLRRLSKQYPSSFGLD